ncbi:electron transport complex subunit RsxG [Mergibacter septicus]|uniref:Ion-translocating oxidoreductase complex subunit G n=1 Tax=Mergibacter septicus TaxID=221402 RepID=A0A8E3MHY1_9PAST|nr:electron transport complex subunit RsxG [Mergibacter septicus]AWX16297.1 electron transport complex subunit RsxG [Mergibacter septicus]QDJ13877.1 electron transport complex subunit RsxG [Mergibacter septicus]QDJ15547.1 electron transport complex subunit RsxG [Mergibacter septicus]UTU48874.1 electron transport complex subunit RsxG [Mergibacter septicus]WMR96821.1 electron transport complex subunit RsxG [Mergibacter septicus]
MNIRKTTIKYGLILALVASICVSISSLVYFLTKGKIEQDLIKRQQMLLAQVIPADYADNDLQQSCYQPIKNTNLSYIKHIYLAQKSGKTTAYAVETIAPDGYSGDIRLLIGITPQGKILGVRTLEHYETPGLGDKIDLRISDWILNFTNKIFDPKNTKIWAVKKDGGEFDQFTGATITPRAVVNAVKYTAETMLIRYPTLQQEALQPCQR